MTNELLNVTPEEIERYQDQIKSDDVQVEDYDLWEKDTVHGKKKSSKGTANFAAYLAIWEDKEGNIQVDEELIDKLDRKQGEFEGFSNPANKSKYENIVERLETKEVDGHRFLNEMIEDFHESADYDRTQIDTTKPENSDHTEGGENDMGYRGEDLSGAPGGVESRIGELDPRLLEDETAEKVVRMVQDLEREFDVKEELGNAVADVVDTYQDLEDQAEDLEEERDQYRDWLHGVADLASDALQADTDELREYRSEIYDLINDRPDFDLYNPDATAIDAALARGQDLVDDRYGGE